MMSMPTRMRLHHRIVVPFAVVALVATSAAAVFAVAVVSQVFQARIETSISNTTEVLSRTGFVANATILRSVKAITGTDVMTFDAAGRVLASTLDDRAELQAAVLRSPAATAAWEAEQPVLVEEQVCRPACLVAYRRVNEGMMAVLADTSDVATATAAIRRPILLAALASLIAMVLVSQFVARRVTAPVERLVGVTRGISEGKPERAPAGDDEIGRLGAAFNEMLDRLERSQAALVQSEKLALAGLLAARVAHDIRNPLASIKIQMQMLEPRLREPDSRAMTAAMLRDIIQLESVVRNLIELARPGELKRRPVDVNDLVRDVLTQLEPQLTHRKIAIDTDLTDHDLTVPIDVDRFKQAFINLVVNAAEAMPEGGTLTVDSQLADGGRRLILDVCDDGTGIDPAVQDRLFDPFVSSKPGGVGLGLVNAKAVIESHGGQIELMAGRIRGTRVRITLPVDRWPTSSS